MGLPSGPRGLSFFSGSAPPAAPPGAGAPAAGGPGFGAGAAIVTDRVQRQATQKIKDKFRLESV